MHLHDPVIAIAFKSVFAIAPKNNIAVTRRPEKRKTANKVAAETEIERRDSPGPNFKHTSPKICN